MSNVAKIPSKVSRVVLYIPTDLNIELSIQACKQLSTSENLLIGLLEDYIESKKQLELFRESVVLTRG